MNKHLIPWYILTSSLVLLFSSAYTVYQCMQHGIEFGLFLTLISWSVYVLCVPAAHGRLIIGGLFKLLSGKSFFPEPYLWGFAIVLNSVSVVFAPQVYAKTLMTYIFYRAIFIPSYWPIFVLTAIGVWYRFSIGTPTYLAHKSTHTAFRHLLTIIGLLVLFYLTHQDFIVLLNATVSG